MYGFVVNYRLLLDDAKKAAEGIARSGFLTIYFGNEAGVRSDYHSGTT
jgi:hypothetical protein